MESNLKQNKRVIFQTDANIIIMQILEKHGLKESVEDFLEKINWNEVSIGEKIASILRKAADEKTNIALAYQYQTASGQANQGQQQRNLADF